jgi:hypothetical protein
VDKAVRINHSNSPLEKLVVSVWLQSVSPATDVFVDDFQVEEF